MINPYVLKKYLPMSKEGGIYFLFDREKIVYIGVTSCIARRIGEHSCGKDWKYKKLNFDSFAYIALEFKTNVERLRIEQQYIRKYKPQYNVAGKASKAL